MHNGRINYTKPKGIFKHPQKPEVTGSPLIFLSFRGDSWEPAAQLGDGVWNRKCGNRKQFGVDEFAFSSFKCITCRVKIIFPKISHFIWRWQTQISEEFTNSPEKQSILVVPKPASQTETITNLQQKLQVFFDSCFPISLSTCNFALYMSEQKL